MTDLAKSLSPGRSREPYYPTSDGKPMAETDKYRDLAVYVIEALKVRYHGQSVYISGNNFLYWEEGNPRAVISPDAYVVFGVEMRQRDTFMTWKEGGALPNVVFEFTSRKTRKEDTEKKLPLYERTLRVPEYFRFDPTGDYLRPRLQGFRQLGGRYVPLELLDGRLHSEELGLDLVQQGEGLRLYDPARGEWLPSLAEEAQARQAAEADNARLRTELEALRRQIDPQP